MSEKHDIEVRLLSLAQGEKMHREGGIVFNEKDIRKSGLSKTEFHQKVWSYYQDRTQRGIEKYLVRVFEKRKAIKIQFVGRSVVDADVISLLDHLSLQDYLSLPVLHALADGAPTK